MEDTRIILIPYFDEELGYAVISHGVGNNTLQNHVLPCERYCKSFADGTDHNGELYLDLATSEERTWMSMSGDDWEDTKRKFRPWMFINDPVRKTF